MRLRKKSHKADHSLGGNCKVMIQKDDLSLMLKIILSYSRDYMVRKVQKVASGKTRITFSRSDFHKNLSAVESHVEKI